MERKLKLKGGTGLFDAPSFILTDNEPLTITLETDEIRFGRYVMTVKNGEKTKTVLLGNDNVLHLTANWLNGGGETLDFSLKMLNHTQTAVVKEGYNIEPLRVERIAGDCTFTGIVQELQAKLRQQSERLSTLEKRVSEYEKNGVELIPEND